MENTREKTYEDLKAEFVQEVRAKFGDLSGETNERNARILDRDEYVYGNRLDQKLDIPFGHDFTPVNWLRRTVEIHKNMFMSRGFQLISTYDSQNEADAKDDDDKGRLRLANAKAKAYAEARKNTIDAIMRDNGGDALWAILAENASAVGDAALKGYYDEEEKRYEICEIEAIENLYALWSRDNFRDVDAYGYVYQVSVLEAISEYGAKSDVATSPMGSPFELIGDNTVTGTKNYTQPMVTILEVTGKIEGWAAEKGKVKRVIPGKETEFNTLIIGDDIKRLIDDEKKIPHYYILPNKRQRRRAWGQSDISDAAININLTYIETFSDWRTHASKVNFQKYKAYGFAEDVQMPKQEVRQTQIIGLTEGQDIQRLDQGDSNAQDFQAQMDECKEQFVRETGISRVLFDDPSVTLNSNQALITSMKPTSDIAEAKKQLWAPIIVQIFEDALETLGMHDERIKEIADPNENWSLKVMWPSVMQKEDPVYQQMLMNRFNSGTMSVQSYMESQGETKEEIDRLRDEMSDPVTAAILGRQLPVLAQQVIAPPADPNAPKPPEIKHNVSWRAEMTPQQEANLANTIPGFQDGPFGMSMGPQGTDGAIAQSNVDNKGFLNGNPRKGGTPIDRGPDGSQIPNPAQKNAEGVNANGGTSTPAQVNTQANNVEGTGAVSQPGSGATTTSPQGAIEQANQQQGA
jgi:hypothetical protein